MRVRSEKTGCSVGGGRGMGREGRRGAGKMTTPIEFNGGRGLAKGAACYASTETCVETSILHVGRAGAAIRIVEIHGCHARERETRP